MESRNQLCYNATMTLTKIFTVLLKASCKIEFIPRATDWGIRAELVITPPKSDQDPNTEFKNVSAGAPATIPIHSPMPFPINEEQLIANLTEIAYFIQALPRPEKPGEEL